MLSSTQPPVNNNYYHQPLKDGVTLTQALVTKCFVEKPKQWHFYCPPSLRAAVEKVFAAQGVSVSEGFTRLGQLLVDADDELRPILLNQAKGDAAVVLARSILQKAKPHRAGVFPTLAAKKKE
jgi:hypothetical protein